MIRITEGLSPRDLKSQVERLFFVSEHKIAELNAKWDARNGSPVYTRAGIYTSRGWTDWTKGFQIGMALLQYDFSDDSPFLDTGRSQTIEHMPVHLTNLGVHDHGFNIVSTYGNLLRLMSEGRVKYDNREEDLYKVSLKVSGAVQASRWTQLNAELGYIYSFNGPHSLFADTIRSLRSLAMAYQLGHVLMVEQDRRVSLLERLLQHAETTARYIIYFGEGRDIYDTPGRVAHEAIFNVDSGTFRCPSSQQGYSPFSTWTRGLAWIILGYAEELEFLGHLDESVFEQYGGKKKTLDRFLNTAQTVAEFYIQNTPLDGIPYWDTGAPGLSQMGDYLSRPADPFNEYEPVDSSAAVIAAQGLIRLGNYLNSFDGSGKRYLEAGLTISLNVFSEPYLSADPNHQGLILHSVYHRPNGWDYVQSGRKIPSGEASMWGDYHALELGLMIHRMAEGKPYLAFFLNTR
ncbi:MAG: glycosyl hydrolase [Bacteroidetes bacterium]|nr:glycosyl hydrolase [Bacteroidota bacterium]